MLSLTNAVHTGPRLGSSPDMRYRLGGPKIMPLVHLREDSA